MALPPPDFNSFYFSVYPTLQSLTEVDENWYYYRDSNTGRFVKSGGALAEYAGVMGGLFATGVQKLCRAGSVSHETLARDVENVAKEIPALLDAKRFEGVSLNREHLHREVKDLRKLARAGLNGVLKFETSYRAEETKRRRLEKARREYEKAMASIEQYFEQLGMEIQRRDGAEAWARLLEEKNREALQGVFKRFTPEREREAADPKTGLTRADLLKVQNFIVIHMKELEKGEIYYCPRSGHGLPRALEIGPRGIFLHLKTHGGIPPIGVGRSGVCRRITKSIGLTPDGIGEVYANSVSKLKEGEEQGRELAENEARVLGILFPYEHNKQRGIIEVKRVQNYPSKKGGAKQSILMKYYKGEDLGEFLMKGVLAENAQIALALDLIIGLEALHAKGIIHSHLKPRNVLVEVGDKGVSAAISDFRLAFNQGGDFKGGSISWMSPEALRRTEWGEKEEIGFSEDIWGMGNLFFLLSKRHYPPWVDTIAKGWEANTVEEREATVNEALDLMVLGFEEPEKGTLLHLAWQMLQSDPKMRPSAEKIRAQMQSIGVKHQVY